MSLRIVGGFLKGRRIEFPSTLSFRPSSEMLRAALFNICQFNLENTHVLDLFSGSGALGIEAMSRGASFCLFVEKDRTSALYIRKNLEKLQLAENSKVLSGDVFSLVRSIQGKFHLVLLDPPYDFSKEHPEKIASLLSQLVERKLLHEKALLFFEEGFSEEHLRHPPLFTSFAHLATRRYGGSLLHYYFLS